MLGQIFGPDSIARENGAFLIAADPRSAGEVAKRLVEGDVELTELRPVQKSLEQAFLELTGAGANHTQES